MDTERKNDITNILIIIVIALGLGVYLAATTVVISKDGVGYIELARQFPADPTGSLKTPHPGYSLLIFAAHRLTSLFTANSSTLTWVYSAQGITLLFQLFALITLYFTGKWLVGSNRSFYAVLILVVLPNPAKMSCEVVREWPYMFFLASGFMFLLWGARQGAPWTFGLAGLSSGLGYWIRPECGQIVVYGLAWLTLSVLRPAVAKMPRRKILAASVLLLIGFACSALPYAKCTGNIISPNAERVIRLLSRGPLSDNADVPCDETGTINHYAAGLVWGSVPKALGEFFKTVGENLMWFFLPFMFIGFYYHMRCEARIEERLFLSIFIFTNMAMMFVRYHYVEAHISNRWTLPLVAFTTFYIPAGLQLMANWLENKRSPRSTADGEPRLFLILLLIGMAICLPKLLRPAGYDKRIFRAAAKWINGNADPVDKITIPDNRIIFYSDRQNSTHVNNNGGDPAVYIVRIITNKDGSHNFGKDVQNETAHSMSNDDSIFSDWMKRFPLNGLIGYWPGTWNTVDYSGHSNHGILQGKTGYATGKFGQAFVLNPSTGDYIDCGNAPGLNPENFIAVSAWIYPTKASKGSILSKNGPYFMEMMANRKIRAGTYAGSPPSWAFVTSDSSLSLNSWHHVAMTYDGSLVRLYIDGTTDGSPVPASGKLWPTTVALYLGYGQLPFDHYFEGMIDEVMIFDRVLSDEEIQLLDSETIGYWKERIVYWQWTDPRKKYRKLVISRIM